MKRRSRLIAQILLIVVLALIAFSAADWVFWEGDKFLNDLLEYTDSHQSALSLVVSTLLLVAYLMQYIIQDAQAEIATQQSKLMSAGYTPIIGVVSREWGKNRGDSRNMKTHEANKYYLKLANNGNSTARDLKLWIGIYYRVNQSTEFFGSNSVPLQRTEEGTWWPTDVGGALSESEGKTEFVAEPKLKRVHRSGFLRRTKECTEIDIGEALESIYDEGEGAEEVSLALSIKYETAAGERQEIEVGAYQERLSKLETSDWTLYNAQESTTKFSDIKSKVH